MLLERFFLLQNVRPAVLKSVARALKKSNYASQVAKCPNAPQADPDAKHIAALKGGEYTMESECTIGDEQQAEANSDRLPTDSSQPSDDSRALELVTSSATASLRIAANEDAAAAAAAVAIAATSSSTGAPVASVARTRSPPPPRSQPIGQNVLPWGDRLRAAPVSGDTPPGEFVLRAMCTEFAIMAGKKIDKVALEPLVRRKKKNRLIQ